MNTYEHSTAGSSDTFQANMVAYLRHVVQPLEAQGFQVVVCGDLSTVVEVEDELLVEASFRTVFGRRVQHFGVQAVMIDDRELASITSAWNTHLISFSRSPVLSLVAFPNLSIFQGRKANHGLNRHVPQSRRAMTQGLPKAFHLQTRLPAGLQNRSTVATQICVFVDAFFFISF